MTENGSEHIDFLIEEVVRRRAGNAGAPVDLLSAVTAEIGETPQQRTGPGTFGGRGSMRLLLVAAAVVVSGTIAIGVVGSARPTTVARLASPNPLTATVLPTLAPADPPGFALDFTTMGGFTAALTSDSVGWARTVKAIFRSTDDGRSWQDTHAPDVLDGSSVRFVSDTAAFAGWRAGNGTMNVAATQDGGATWITTALASAPNDVGPILNIRSATAASATLIDEPDTASAHLRIWSTTDGGRTWDGPMSGQIPGQNKPYGWGTGAMWLNVGKVDGVPFDERLWISFDGGVSWPQRTFPTNAEVPRGALAWLVGPPLMDRAGRLVVLVSNIDGEGLFASADDGRTWQLIRWFPDEGGTLDPQWLSDQEWVLTNGTDIWSTVDGGVSWRHVVEDPPVGSLSDTFVSPDHAWATHGCDRRGYLRRGPDPLCTGNTKTGFLLETTDGGKSWQQVGG